MKAAQVQPGSLVLATVPLLELRRERSHETFNNPVTAVVRYGGPATVLAVTGDWCLVMAAGMRMGWCQLRWLVNVGPVEDKRAAR